MVEVNIFVINLSSAVERRNFQKTQFAKLRLNFNFLDAVSVHDIDESDYKQHINDWQRPLRLAEVACYYSHRSAWNMVIESDQPALILEDDALLSKCVPVLLETLMSKKGVDLITLENSCRKKFVAKMGKDVGCNSNIIRLYQDRTGAAGYILYPSGAEKLIQCERRKGIALADAHITACRGMRSYQVEPSPIVQLDYCKDYGIRNPTQVTASESTVSIPNNPKGGWIFWFKRVYSQIKLGLRQLSLIIKSERRYIKIRIEDFS